MKLVPTITAMVVVLSFIAATVSYDKLPEKMAIHWNIQGNPDSYASKSYVTALIFPVLIAFVVALLYFLPSIDPLKPNLKEFEDHYHLFILIFSLFLVSVQYQTLLWNMGRRLDPFIVISPGLGMLFYYLGVLLQFVKRNWFIGIRTPWTLSSDVVWDKTHAVASKMFKACGILAFAGIMVPAYSVILIIVPVLFTAAYTIVYSFREYKKL